MLPLLGPDDYVSLALQTFDPSVTPGTTWGSPEAVRAWDLYRGLLDDGYLTAGHLADDYPTASNLFVTEAAPMVSMGSWATSRRWRPTAPSASFPSRPWIARPGTSTTS